MKEILGTKDNLVSLLAHANSGKNLFILCKTDRHISSYLGVMMFEVFTQNTDGFVKTLPSGLSKLDLRDSGEIIFGTEESDMQAYEAHIKVQIITKK